MVRRSTPSLGHHPHPSDREGESLQRRAVCRASHLREVSLQERMDLRVQGRLGGEPPRGHHGLRFGRGGFGRAAEIGDYFLIAQDRHDAYTWPTRVSPRWNGKSAGWNSTGLWWQSYAQEHLQKGVDGVRAPLGIRQAPDHRGSHRSAQGLLRPGAPHDQDPGWSVGTLGGKEITAFTFGEWLNVQLGRPMRHLADLLV
jgi:hypothetical protein